MADSHSTGRPMARTYLLAAVACLALVLILTLAAASSATRSAPPARTCFPAAKWDARKSARPCARIVRVLEDGSLVVAVTDADGKSRYRATVAARDR